MAKSIDPFKRRPDPTLLAKATGQVEPTPPPASLIPGVTGNPPLPTGKVVGHLDPATLTDVERAALHAASGWTPDVKLPTSAQGLKEIQAVVAAATAGDVKPPVPEDTPPLRVTTVSAESLSAAERAKFQGLIAGITANDAERAAAANRAASADARGAGVPGLGAAYQAADKAADEFRRKAALPPLEIEVTGSGATPVQPPAAPPPTPPTAPPPTPPAQPAKPPAQPAKPPASETGADAPLTHCPHCEWDLRVADTAAPTHGDKMAFLHCLLGDRPFVKDYTLFGGAVQVTFRTLATREVDVAYLQAFADQLPTELDYFERVNRYRMILQLQAYRATSPGGFDHVLPDGYSKSRNPTCDGVWVTAEREDEMAKNETGLKEIETWLVENVLKTEYAFRAVSNACRQFNRLAAKLEAMADNSDFWSPTGEPS